MRSFRAARVLYSAQYIAVLTCTALASTAALMRLRRLLYSNQIAPWFYVHLILAWTAANGTASIALCTSMPHIKADATR
eukprot:m.124858 g.124858  ORF g.124858 m.124858 type:complete len:79 (-) comp22095_c1_seq2:27-263(-)